MYRTIFLGPTGFLGKTNGTNIVLLCCWLIFGIVHVIYSFFI
jgi:hypothetical protein